MIEIVILVFSGFLCGVLNAIAGGGTFVTLPTLIWIGVPPVVANATSTAAAVPGYAASAWAYREQVRAEGTLHLNAIIGIAVLGGILGGLLLVVSDADAFTIMVPWLLLTATILFAIAPKLLTALNSVRTGSISQRFSSGLMLAVTTYGGYFNGGLGVIVLAALSLQGYRNLHGMNGLKSLLALILSVASVATFTIADLIIWEVTAPLIVGNICGASMASYFVQHVRRTDWLRIMITGIGFVMSGLFFLF